MAKVLSSYTLEDVEKHNKKNDWWVAVHGKVYDVSKFTDHPGGEDPIIEYSGKDATQAFDAAGHDGEVIWDMDSRFLIGTL